jgi:hypothetical protein
VKSGIGGLSSGANGPSGSGLSAQVETQIPNLLLSPAGSGGDENRTAANASKSALVADILKALNGDSDQVSDLDLIVLALEQNAEVATEVLMALCEHRDGEIDSAKRDKMATLVIEILKK